MLVPGPARHKSTTRLWPAPSPCSHQAVASTVPSGQHGTSTQSGRGKDVNHTCTKAVTSKAPVHYLAVASTVPILTPGCSQHGTSQPPGREQHGTHSRTRLWQARRQSTTRLLPAWYPYSVQAVASVAPVRYQAVASTVPIFAPSCKQQPPVPKL
jgi:hypothetical protein